MHASEEHALVTRAKRGDTEAFNALIAEYRPHLVAAALRRMPKHLGDNIAEEVVQEACLKGWKQLPKLDDGRFSFIQWMLMNVRDAWSARARHAQAGGCHYCREVSQPKDPGSGPGPLERVACDNNTPSRGVRQQERKHRLWEAVEKICTERDQKIVKLFYVDGKPIAAIAETMKVAEGTVRNILTNARRDLEAHLRRSDFYSSR